MKKLSLRIRLTLISVSLLLLCCLGLTLVLNRAAGNMADTIEMSPLEPSITGDPEQNPAAGSPDTSDNAGSDDASADHDSTGSVDTDNTGSTGFDTSAITPAVPVLPAPASVAARELFLRQSVLAMLLIAAAGGLLTWFITGRALRPLRNLSQEMQNRTVQTLSEELPVPESHDEIASLTRSFNEMSQKLDEAFSMQKRFSQSAAHELRTPLTVLKAKVDVFGKRAEHTPEEYETLLRLVNTQTNRMTDLVNDLLGLTNLDALSCDQKVSLRPLLSEVAEELTPLAAQKNVSLTLKSVNCATIGNANLLRQAFSNLVENAIKYNNIGGIVSVDASLADEKVIIRVTDNGPGIPDDQKTLIFEPFYRVDKSRSRQMGGAGLGLATVKAILEKHAGEIRVEDAPGGGSIFTVTLTAA